MSQAYFLPYDAVTDWLRKIAETMRVTAPVREGNSVVFRDFDPEEPLVLGHQSAASPKSVVFPQLEYLFRYKTDRTADENGVRQITLEPIYPDEDVFVFGANPCGARGLTTLDPVFINDEYVDPYYKARRERSIIASIVCTLPGDACFCHWVGGNPNDPVGSDLVLTPIEGGYLVRAHSGKGEKLAAGLDKADAREEQAAQQVEDAVLATLDPPPDLTDCPDVMENVFDDMELWEQVSDKCIYCGACTYYCPTCYCFNITDEASGIAGERIRSWDSCMFPTYTREASGHNPRPTKAHRFRNRILHKFSYYPKLYNRVFSCTGCGRCIRMCPTTVDIRDAVLRVKEAATKDESAKEVSDG